jgi:hypothetical protein
MTPPERLPELDREHDPAGGAILWIFLAWLIVLSGVVALALWWVTR